MCVTKLINILSSMSADDESNPCIHMIGSKILLLLSTFAFGQCMQDNPYQININNAMILGLNSYPLSF